MNSAQPNKEQYQLDKEQHQPDTEQYKPDTKQYAPFMKQCTPILSFFSLFFPPSFPREAPTLVLI